jgi:hypothetical protein
MIAVVLIANDVSGLVAAPGTGYSIYINTITLQFGFSGGPNIGSLSVQDGAGNTYAMILGQSTNTLLSPLVIPLNGFRTYADNARLDANVNAVGAATIIALVHITYYVGITQ